MCFLHVSCGKLKMTTRKTSKVWDYFELEGNGKVLCKLCNVKLAYNNFTGAMRNHIQYRHVCVSLEASQSHVNHVIQPAAAVRDPIRAVYSSKPVVLNLFFHRDALWSKCKSHGPHACHLHITSSIQTNQIYNIIYSLNIMISKRLHLLK